MYQTPSVDFYTPFKGESSDFKFLKSNLGESRDKKPPSQSCFHYNTLGHRNCVFFSYKTFPIPL